MTFEDLNPELREKARQCTTPEEYLELAKREGLQLSEEGLQAVSGGGEWGGPNCEHFDTCTVD